MMYHKAIVRERLVITYELLDKDVALTSERRNIIDYRYGPDQRPRTETTVSSNVEELDEIPYVTEQLGQYLVVRHDRFQHIDQQKRRFHEVPRLRHYKAFSISRTAIQHYRYENLLVPLESFDSKLLSQPKNSRWVLSTFGVTQVRPVVVLRRFS